MPIQGFEQPEILPVNETIRLKRYSGECAFALEWYQDGDMLWLVGHDRTPYTMEKLQRMYAWLDAHGELYWIEAMQDGQFVPIGDVTFWQQDMPIVIGCPEWRRKGIGRSVVQALAQRARALGYTEIYVDQIYHENTPSRHCFESAGFQPAQRTEKGQSYVLKF